MNKTITIRSEYDKEGLSGITTHCRFRVIIVGGGIGGLATALACALSGHDVVLVEAVAKLGEVGAGLQLPPNMFRILASWGLGDDIIRCAVPLSATLIMRWEDGSILAGIPANNQYGTQYVIHRGDLYLILLESVKSLPNIQVLTDARAVNVDFVETSVTLEGGRVLAGDVIVGADGIKSTVRGLMLGKGVQPMPTGDCAYRLVLSRKVLESDPDLKELVDAPVGIRWVGPGRHVMAYPMKGHQLYNMVLVHPDDSALDCDSWASKATKTEVLATYQGWNPLLLRLIEKADDDKVMKWKLCTTDTLSSWTRGNVCLLGDACHPMLPYVAQGAAQAIEDATTLSILLDSISAPSQIRSALDMYELSRKFRCERIQSTARANRTSLHLPDGLEQEIRDQLFSQLSQGAANPDKWGNPAHQRFVWGYSAQRVAAKAAALIPFLADNHYNTSEEQSLLINELESIGLPGMNYEGEEKKGEKTY